MAAVRIGIVGGGYMGRLYARLVGQHPLAELAGIVDVDEGARRSLAESAGTMAYAEIGDLLDRERLDGLIVANPEDAHRAPSVAALERGIGVLVEKPIASTREDGEAIVAAARASGALLMVGHVLRFDSRYVALKEAVAAGQIGQPLYAFARRHNGKGAQQRLKGRCSLPLFLGVHDYDAIRWVVGSDVTSVVARERRGFLEGAGYPVEDVSVAVLTFANGALGVVEEGWVLPDGHAIGFDQRLEVNGTTGRVELEGSYTGVTLATDERTTLPETALWPVVHGRVGGALEREANHFIDCLGAGGEPLVTGEDGLTALKVALAVAWSARTGETVTLGAG